MSVAVVKFLLPQTISLKANDVEHLFMCLFVIYISSLVKYLFRSFVRFLVGTSVWYF